MRRGAERNDGCCIQDSRAHSTPYKEYNATMASPYSESSKQSNYHSRCSREEGDRRTGLRIRDEDTESALNQPNHHLEDTGRVTIDGDFWKEITLVRKYDHFLRLKHLI